MTHSIYNSELETSIVVDETQCENTSISINSESSTILTMTHYLTPKELSDFIGVLLHIQAKKRKEYNTKF